MSLSLFRTAGGAALEVNPNFIKTELGITLKATQDANTAESIEKPADFIKKRSLKIEKLFDLDPATARGTADGPVALAYKAKFDELSKLGLPSDIVTAMAKSHATRLYEEYLYLYELEAPDGYKRAFSVIKDDHNAVIAKNELSDTGISAIEGYKAYKKAKKASKK
jgi:hypothetical protein